MFVHFLVDQMTSDFHSLHEAIAEQRQSSPISSDQFFNLASTCCNQFSARDVLGLMHQALEDSPDGMSVLRASQIEDTVLHGGQLNDTVTTESLHTFFAHQPHIEAIVAMP